MVFWADGVRPTFKAMITMFWSILRSRIRFEGNSNQQSTIFFYSDQIQVQKAPTLVETERNLPDKFEGTEFKLATFFMLLKEATFSWLLIKEVKLGCGSDYANCALYKQCSGVGDRMNTQRGAPDVSDTQPYANFALVSSPFDSCLTLFKEKFGRTVDKVFQPECGFKMDRIERLTERYEDMIQRMVGWSQKCKRYSGENCPSYCELQDGECMTPKGMWFEKVPLCYSFRLFSNQNSRITKPTIVHTIIA